MLWIGGDVPLIEPGDDYATLADALAADMDGEFAVDPFIAPDHVEAAALGRFMPMSMTLETPDGSMRALTPKLHLERCLLDPAAARPTRTALREAARYELSVNLAFDEALAACVASHGDEWLSPELASAFSLLHGQRASRKAAFASVELWKGGELAAGEIGYLIGSAYASLSGFRLVSGAGTVQLYALAAALRGMGVKLWDLGMAMPYKTALGGRAFPRDAYLPALGRAYGEAAPAADRAFRSALAPLPARGLLSTGQAGTMLA